jgi:hypothetical protein
LRGSMLASVVVLGDRGMRVKSGVASRKTAARGTRPVTRTYPARPALPKGAKRQELAWHTFSVGTITGLRDAGFAVSDRDDGHLIQSGGKVKLSLILVKRTTEGGYLAQAAGNTPFGRSVAFGAMAVQARVRVDRALRRLAGNGTIDAFVMTMKGIRADLQKASVVKPPKPKATRIPSGIILNSEDRITSVRAASAGLPTLGKRR